MDDTENHLPDTDSNTFDLYDNLDPSSQNQKGLINNEENVDVDDADIFMELGMMGGNCDQMEGDSVKRTGISEKNGVNDDRGDNISDVEICSDDKNGRKSKESNDDNDVKVENAKITGKSRKRCKEDGDRITTTKNTARTKTKDLIQNEGGDKSAKNGGNALESSMNKLSMSSNPDVQFVLSYLTKCLNKNGDKSENIVDVKETSVNDSQKPNKKSEPSVNIKDTVKDSKKSENSNINHSKKPENTVNVKDNEKPKGNKKTKPVVNDKKSETSDNEKNNVKESKRTDKHNTSVKDSKKSEKTNVKDKKKPAKPIEKVSEKSIIKEKKKHVESSEKVKEKSNVNDSKKHMESSEKVNDKSNIKDTGKPNIKDSRKHVESSEKDVEKSIVKEKEKTVKTSEKSNVNDSKKHVKPSEKDSEKSDIKDAMKSKEKVANEKSNVKDSKTPVESSEKDGGNIVKGSEESVESIEKDNKKSIVNDSKKPSEPTALRRSPRKKRRSIKLLQIFGSDDEAGEVVKVKEMFKGCKREKSRENRNDKSEKETTTEHKSKEETKFETLNENKSKKETKSETLNANRSKKESKYKRSAGQKGDNDTDKMLELLQVNMVTNQPLPVPLSEPPIPVKKPVEPVTDTQSLAQSKDPRRKPQDTPVSKPAEPVIQSATQPKDPRRKPDAPVSKAEPVTQSATQPKNPRRKPDTPVNQSERPVSKAEPVTQTAMKPKKPRLPVRKPDTPVNSAILVTQSPLQLTHPPVNQSPVPANQLCHPVGKVPVIQSATQDTYPVMQTQLGLPSQFGKIARPTLHNQSLSANQSVQSTSNTQTVHQSSLHSNSVSWNHNQSNLTVTQSNLLRLSVNKPSHPVSQSSPHNYSGYLTVPPPLYNQSQPVNQSIQNQSISHSNTQSQSSSSVTPSTEKTTPKPSSAVERIFKLLTMPKRPTAKDFMNVNMEEDTMEPNSASGKGNQIVEGVGEGERKEMKSKIEEKTNEIERKSETVERKDGERSDMERRIEGERTMEIGSEMERKGSDLYDECSDEEGESSQKKDDGELDLFEEFLVGRDRDEMTQEITTLKSQLTRTSQELKESKERCVGLETDNATILRNMSSLWATAIAQLRQKTGEIADLRREKEAIIFRRGMRQISKDDMDAAVSRIAAYNKDEFVDFLHTLKREETKCSCGGTGVSGTSGPKIPIRQKIQQAVRGTRVGALDSDAQALQAVLGRKGESITFAQENQVKGKRGKKLKRLDNRERENENLIERIVSGREKLRERVEEDRIEGRGRVKQRETERLRSRGRLNSLTSDGKNSTSKDVNRSPDSSFKRRLGYQKDDDSSKPHSTEKRGSVFSRLGIRGSQRTRDGKSEEKSKEREEEKNERTRSRRKTREEVKKTEQSKEYKKRNIDSERSESEEEEGELRPKKNHATRQTQNLKIQGKERDMNTNGDKFSDSGTEEPLCKRENDTKRKEKPEKSLQKKENDAKKILKGGQENESKTPRNKSKHCPISWDLEPSKNSDSERNLQKQGERLSDLENDRIVENTDGEEITKPSSKLDNSKHNSESEYAEKIASTNLGSAMSDTPLNTMPKDPIEREEEEMLSKTLFGKRMLAKMKKQKLGGISDQSPTVQRAVVKNGAIEKLSKVENNVISTPNSDPNEKAKSNKNSEGNSTETVKTSEKTKQKSLTNEISTHTSTDHNSVHGGEKPNKNSEGNFAEMVKTSEKSKLNKGNSQDKEHTESHPCVEKPVDDRVMEETPVKNRLDGNSNPQDSKQTEASQFERQVEESELDETPMKRLDERDGNNTVDYEGDSESDDYKSTLERRKRNGVEKESLEIKSRERLSRKTCSDDDFDFNWIENQTLAKRIETKRKQFRKIQRNARDVDESTTDGEEDGRRERFRRREKMRKEKSLKSPCKKKQGKVDGKKKEKREYVKENEKEKREETIKESESKKMKKQASKGVNESEREQTVSENEKNKESPLKVANDIGTEKYTEVATRKMEGLDSERTPDESPLLPLLLSSSSEAEIDIEGCPENDVRNSDEEGEPSEKEEENEKTVEKSGRLAMENESDLEENGKGDNETDVVKNSLESDNVNRKIDTNICDSNKDEIASKYDSSSSKSVNQKDVDAEKITKNASDSKTVNSSDKSFEGEESGNILDTLLGGNYNIDSLFGRDEELLYEEGNEESEPESQCSEKEIEAVRSDNVDEEKESETVRLDEEEASDDAEVKKQGQNDTFVLQKVATDDRVKEQNNDGRNEEMRHRPKDTSHYQKVATDKTPSSVTQLSSTLQSHIPRTPLDNTETCHASLGSSSSNPLNEGMGTSNTISQMKRIPKIKKNTESRKQEEIISPLMQSSMNKEEEKSPMEDTRESKRRRGRQAKKNKSDSSLKGKENDLRRRSESEPQNQIEESDFAVSLGKGARGRLRREDDEKREMSRREREERIREDRRREKEDIGKRNREERENDNWRRGREEDQKRNSREERGKRERENEERWGKRKRDDDDNEHPSKRRRGPIQSRLRRPSSSSSGIRESISPVRCYSTSPGTETQAERQRMSTRLQSKGHEREDRESHAERRRGRERKISTRSSDGEDVRGRKMDRNSDGKGRRGQNMGRRSDAEDGREQKMGRRSDAEDGRGRRVSRGSDAEDSRAKKISSRISDGEDGRTRKMGRGSDVEDSRRRNSYQSSDGEERVDKETPSKIRVDSNLLKTLLNQSPSMGIIEEDELEEGELSDDEEEKNEKTEQKSQLVKRKEIKKTGRNEEKEKPGKELSKIEDKENKSKTRNKEVRKDELESQVIEDLTMSEDEDEDEDENRSINKKPTNIPENYEGQSKVKEKESERPNKTAKKGKENAREKQKEPNTPTIASTSVVSDIEKDQARKISEKESKSMQIDIEKPKDQKGTLTAKESKLKNEKEKQKDSTKTPVIESKQKYSKKIPKAKSVFGDEEEGELSEEEEERNEKIKEKSEKIKKKESKKSKNEERERPGNKQSKIEEDKQNKSTKNKETRKDKPESRVTEDDSSSDEAKQPTPKTIRRSRRRNSSTKMYDLFGTPVKGDSLDSDMLESRENGVKPAKKLIQEVVNSSNSSNTPQNYTSDSDSEENSLEKVMENNSNSRIVKSAVNFTQKKVESGKNTQQNDVNLSESDSDSETDRLKKTKENMAVKSVKNSTSKQGNSKKIPQTEDNESSGMDKCIDDVLKSPQNSKGNKKAKGNLKKDKFTEDISSQNPEQSQSKTNKKGNTLKSPKRSMPKSPRGNPFKSPTNQSTNAEKITLSKEEQIKLATQIIPRQTRRQTQQLQEKIREEDNSKTILDVLLPSPSKDASRVTRSAARQAASESLRQARHELRRRLNKEHLDENATAFPADLFRVVPRSEPAVVPEEKENSMTSGSDDTIDLIVKLHNENFNDSGDGDDSETSLLQFITEDEYEEEGQRDDRREMSSESEENPGEVNEERREREASKERSEGEEEGHLKEDRKEPSDDDDEWENEEKNDRLLLLESSMEEEEEGENVNKCREENKSEGSNGEMSEEENEGALEGEKKKEETRTKDGDENESEEEIEEDTIEDKMVGNKNQTTTPRNENELRERLKELTDLTAKISPILSAERPRNNRTMSSSNKNKTITPRSEEVIERLKEVTDLMPKISPILSAERGRSKRIISHSTDAINKTTTPKNEELMERLKEVTDSRPKISPILSAERGRNNRMTSSSNKNKTITPRNEDLIERLKEVSDAVKPKISPICSSEKAKTRTSLSLIETQDTPISSRSRGEFRQTKLTLKNTQTDRSKGDITRSDAETGAQTQSQSSIFDLTASPNESEEEISVGGNDSEDENIKNSEKIDDNVSDKNTDGEYSESDIRDRSSELISLGLDCTSSEDEEEEEKEENDGRRGSEGKGRSERDEIGSVQNTIENEENIHNENQAKGAESQTGVERNMKEGMVGVENKEDNFDEANQNSYTIEESQESGHIGESTQSQEAEAAEGSDSDSGSSSSSSDSSGSECDCGRSSCCSSSSSSSDSGSDHSVTLGSDTEPDDVPIKSPPQVGNLRGVTLSQLLESPHTTSSTGTFTVWPESELRRTLRKSPRKIGSETPRKAVSPRKFNVTPRKSRKSPRKFDDEIPSPTKTPITPGKNIKSPHKTPHKKSPHKTPCKYTPCKRTPCKKSHHKTPCKKSPHKTPKKTPRKLGGLPRIPETTSLMEIGIGDPQTESAEGINERTNHQESSLVYERKASNLTQAGLGNTNERIVGKSNTSEIRKKNRYVRRRMPLNSSQGVEKVGVEEGGRMEKGVEEERREMKGRNVEEMKIDSRGAKEKGDGSLEKGGEENKLVKIVEAKDKVIYMKHKLSPTSDTSSPPTPVIETIIKRNKRPVNFGASSGSSQLSCSSSSTVISVVHEPRRRTKSVAAKTQQRSLSNQRSTSDQRSASEQRNKSEQRDGPNPQRKGEEGIVVSEVPGQKSIGRSNSHDAEFHKEAQKTKSKFVEKLQQKNLNSSEETATKPTAKSKQKKRQLSPSTNIFNTAENIVSKKMRMLSPGMYSNVSQKLLFPVDKKGNRENDKGETQGLENAEASSKNSDRGKDLYEGNELDKKCSDSNRNRSLVDEQGKGLDKAKDSKISNISSSSISESVKAGSNNGMPIKIRKARRQLNLGCSSTSQFTTHVVSSDSASVRSIQTSTKGSMSRDNSLDSQSSLRRSPRKKLKDNA